MAYIPRAISDILKSRVKNSKCTLIVGARQVGKSTLVKREFPEFNRSNFDDRLTRVPVPCLLTKYRRSLLFWKRLN